jgi:hypothetical protein
MNTFVRTVLSSVPPVVVLLASGCGGGGGGSSVPAVPTAAASVAVCDSPSDEIAAFTVVVTAITVTRPNVPPVNLLTDPVAVDLTQFSDVSRLVDLKNIPPGSYQSASISFNFGPSAAWLVGQTTPATLLDSLGSPLLGTFTFPIDLAGASFEAQANHHHLLEFDFDMNQSLTVDAVGNSATVVPAILLRVDRSGPRDLVVAGTIASVSTMTSTAVVDLDAVSKISGGESVNLAFDVDTIYQVDGVPMTGAAGLLALAAEPNGTAVQAVGTSDPGHQRLLVKFVEAGKGTWNGGQDVVDGYVVDRSGAAGADATLTVAGFSSNAAHTSFQFNAAFTVATSFQNTTVLHLGDATQLTTDQLNVGQRIVAYGALSGTSLDATAAGAVVRELPTTVSGTANGAPFGSTVVPFDISRIGLLDPSLFVWADSGTPATDPHNCAIDIGSLGNGLTIDSGTPLIAGVYFAGFDDATAIDATATTLVDDTNGPVTLTLHDRAGGFTVVTTAGSGQIEFTISGTAGPDELAMLDAGFRGSASLPTSPDPIITADPLPVLFLVNHESTGWLDCFTSFDDFVTAVATALSGGETLRDFVAIGSYDGGTNTCSASFATAVLE